MKQFIKEALRENLTKKRYFGQCDVVRGMSDQNEEFWHSMMANKKQIPIEKFLSSVDFKAVLDDDENPNDYINDAIRQDPDTATYLSTWDNKETMFLQTAGFEFIFI